MKPVLKYSGGKQKEIQNFIGLTPPSFETYYEPFFGGGATFFHIAPEKAMVGDVNQRLIRFYQEIASDAFCEIKRELMELQKVYEQNQKEYQLAKSLSNGERVKNKNEDLYYLLRDMFNGKVPLAYHYATVYYFINKTAYSGMIRYNSKGEFNVPFGRYANFNTDLLKEEHHELLEKAEIYLGSYQKSFELATSKDFIFLDPPYDSVFTGYGNETLSGDFKEKEHRVLAEDFKNLSSPAMMVISKTPLITELYAPFVKEVYQKQYAVNIRNRVSVKTEHLVITNY